MASLLLSSRFINATSIIIAVVSGLYGFNGILGRPGGLLRQLIVAIPQAGFFAVFNYFYDEATHHIYSTGLSIALSEFANISVPPGPFLWAVALGVSGLLLSLTNPNSLRSYRKIKLEVSRTSLIIYAIASTISSFVFDIVLIVTSVHFAYPFRDIEPPLYVILLYAIIQSALTATTILLNYKNTVVGCLYTILSIPIFLLLVLDFKTFGWSIVFLILGGFVIVYFIILLQQLADGLSDKNLQHIGLTLFLIAGSLQIYQAIAL
jgi:uncharacterized integral membrane protein